MAQVPLAHVPRAFAGAHTAPHAPQLVTDVSDDSHPGALVQSAKPRLHDTNVHVRVAQLAVAFGSEQATPQPPQFASVLRLVSQPFESIVSQLPKPAAQVSVRQPPVAHDAVAFARVHAAPQPPQLVRVVVGVSQPSGADRLQSANPPLHVTIAQLPLAHRSLAFARSQRVPHPPQLARSVAVSTQLIAQRVSPVAQPLTHPTVPPTVPHNGSAALHDVVHAPQVAALARSASQPLSRRPSQSANPALHAATHAPAVHSGSPLATAGHASHAAPHCDVEASDTHSPPHSWKPGRQSGTQNPPTQ